MQTREVYELQQAVAELERKVADHDQRLQRQSHRIGSVVNTAARNVLDQVLGRLRRAVLDRP